jgi:hypothetical protein
MNNSYKNIEDILTSEEEIIIENLRINKLLEIKKEENEIKKTEELLIESNNKIKKTELELINLFEKSKNTDDKLLSKCSNESNKEDQKLSKSSNEILDNEYKIKLLENNLREAQIIKEIINCELQVKKSKYEAKFSLLRRIGLNPIVIITNISGKKVWLILSPAPIVSIGSLGIDKVGQISFTTTGDYKCQQSVLSNNTSNEFELDNSQIYYTVLFDCNGKWKIPFKDRKINTRKYDINILERHVNDAIDFEFMP